MRRKRQTGQSVMQEEGRKQGRTGWDEEDGVPWETDRRKANPDWRGGSIIPKVWWTGVCHQGSKVKAVGEREKEKE